MDLIYPNAEMRRYRLKRLNNLTVKPEAPGVDIACVNGKTNGRDSALTFINFHLVCVFWLSAFLSVNRRHTKGTTAFKNKTNQLLNVLRRKPLGRLNLISVVRVHVPTASRLVQIRSSSKVAAVRSASRRR